MAHELTNSADGPASDPSADHVADVLPEAAALGCWNEFRDRFRQLIRIIQSGSLAPRALSDALVDAIEAVSPSYAGREVTMCRHVLAVLADILGAERLDIDTFRNLYHDDFGLAAGRASSDRRTPSLLEAIVETCRRQRDTRVLRDLFRDLPLSMIPIGSTVYGPYRNVRGNRGGSDASDLDLLLVVDSPEVLPAIMEALAEVPHASHGDVGHLARRASIFTEQMDSTRTILSHKVALWSGDSIVDRALPAPVAPADYLVSMHFMTPAVLDYMLVASAPSLRRETAGSRRTVRDFREAPRAGDDDLRNFLGEKHRFNLESECCTGGVLRFPRAYHIGDQDDYRPGFYQMMLIPRPDPVLDNLDVKPRLHAFQMKLAERVRYEAGLRGHALVRQSFAHVRRDAFTPSVLRLLDGSDAY